ncbi:glycoside hydrolase [Lodderomyces elongisporus]|uniref:glycoside hydrolase n=1 Tax=Lodderomyces elongisporus TaxID=36914 RepID=UPI0029241E61|nr:glycoside hydrolase [Lodderomyces elongisporus]WLF77828.1 glycoside hydrolase [Lodderomyces elongisporus]
MNFKSILATTLVLASQVFAADGELEQPQETVIVTNTHYVQSPCISSLAANLLSNNVQGLTTGIPVVIVHKPRGAKSVSSQQQQQQQQQQQSQLQLQQKGTVVQTNFHTVYETVYPTTTNTAVTTPATTTTQTTQTKQLAATTSTESCKTFTSTYTTMVAAAINCVDGVCQTSTITSVLPTTYTSTYTVSSSTAINQKSTTNKGQQVSSTTRSRNSAAAAAATATAASDRNDISYGLAPGGLTATESFATTDVETAVTTTSTIFTASQDLSSTFEPETTMESVLTNKPAPVTSQSVVPESKSITIDVSSITQDVTISGSGGATNNLSTQKQNSTTNLSDLAAAAASATTSATDSTRLSNILETTIVATNNDKASSTEHENSEFSFTSRTTLSTVVLTSSFVASYGNSSVIYSSTYSSIETISTVVPVSETIEASIQSSPASVSSSTSASALTSASTSSLGSASSTLSDHLSSSSLASESSIESLESMAQTSSASTESSAYTDSCYNGDLFAPIDTDAPPSIFSRQELPLAIPAGVNNNGAPIQTNKFYANLFLGDQTMMVYTYPYAVYRTAYTTDNPFNGLGIQVANKSMRVFGNVNSNNDNPSYYFNPTNNAEVIFSATQFASGNALYMGVTDMTEMAVKVTLSESSDDDINTVEIPIVQGMGFVTSIYNGNLIANLDSMYGFRTLVSESSSAIPSNIIKYRATLFNGVEWLIYVTLPSADPEFTLQVSKLSTQTSSDGRTMIVASKAIDGLMIQVAIAPGQTGDQYYDAAAGMYVTDAEFSGSVVCSGSATFDITYKTAGTSTSGNPIIFALPHHLTTLNGADAGATGIQVLSQTKGYMSGFLTKVLSFAETINKDIRFLPYIQGASTLEYSAEKVALLATSANEELAVNIAETVSNMNSNYFSGKVIDKYAQILLVVDEIIKDDAVTNATLAEMKTAFETFINNEQYYPLMYDTKFGGVTSTAAQNGDTGADFGAAYYNDHHFHYGYFVHAAAVVGYIDKKLGGTWAQDNKDWVNSLVRDVANPSRQDTYFPVSRSFSWYDGHSWAAGLFAANDGKNQESSSEDIHFAYGMKLWGNVVEDYAMEARGGVMLNIMSRAFNMYFYFKSDNTIQPSEILPNKVCGIFFENKVDYTTYFGTPKEHPEYVHGIHMLPITAASSSIRIPSYVQEEWDDQVSTFVDNVTDGWAGILRLNQAIIDPSTSYDFFSSSSWTNAYLDNGQSRTWSLAYAGAFS